MQLIPLSDLFEKYIGGYSDRTHPIYLLIKYLLPKDEMAPKYGYSNIDINYILIIRL